MIFSNNHCSYIAICSFVRDITVKVWGSNSRMKSISLCLMFHILDILETYLDLTFIHRKRFFLSFICYVVMNETVNFHKLEGASTFLIFLLHAEARIGILQRIYKFLFHLKQLFREIFWYYVNFLLSESCKTLISNPITCSTN